MRNAEWEQQSVQPKRLRSSASSSATAIPRGTVTAATFEGDLSLGPLERLGWALELAAGETKTIQYRYKVYVRG